MLDKTIPGAQLLKQNHVSAVVPEVLPIALYSDASHPLTQGYDLLAKLISADATFRN